VTSVEPVMSFQETLAPWIRIFHIQHPYWKIWMSLKMIMGTSR